jgi:hypothetical protein
MFFCNVALPILHIIKKWSLFDLLESWCPVTPQISRIRQKSSCVHCGLSPPLAWKLLLPSSWVTHSLYLWYKIWTQGLSLASQVLYHFNHVPSGHSLLRCCILEPSQCAVIAQPQRQREHFWACWFTTNLNYHS